MKSFLMVAAATLTMSLSAASAYAQDVPEMDVMLIKTDQNDDMLLSKAEVLEVAIQQFAIVDLDGNGILDAVEAGDMAADAEFKDNDDDKDGALSIDEMIAEKLADFASLDADKDGFVSFEELSTAADKK